jgi:hypothetical protein
MLGKRLPFLLRLELREKYHCRPHSYFDGRYGRGEGIDAGGYSSNCSAHLRAATAYLDREWLAMSTV